MCWRAFYPWTVLVWQLIWFVFVLSSSFRMMEAASGTGTHRIRSRPPSLQQRQQQQHGNRQFRDWQDVYIAGFFALSDHEIESALGQGVMPAISLALRHLANSTYLHDYRLRLLHNDTQVPPFLFYTSARDAHLHIQHNHFSNKMDMHCYYYCLHVCIQERQKTAPARF